MELIDFEIVAIESKYVNGGKDTGAGTRNTPDCSFSYTSDCSFTDSQGNTEIRYCGVYDSDCNP